MARGTALFLATLCVVAAHAEESLAQAPITDNDFRVDLSQGLVLSGSRIVGLSGAFTALGTGIDGAAYNPASYAARDMWEHRRFTWGVTLGLAFPGAFKTDDYFNANRVGLDIENSFYFDAGLRIQVGYGAGGVLGTFQQYELNSGTEQYRVRFGTVYTGVAGAFLREALVVGVGIRTALLQVHQLNVGRMGPLVSFSGFAPQVGALIRPEGKRFRIGAALHLPVESTIANTMLGSDMVGEHYIPRSVNLPWQFNVGIAVQLGERPMNIHWVKRPDPDVRAAEERDARRCARLREQRTWESQRGPSAEASGGPLAGAPTLPNPSACADAPRPADPAFWAQEAIIRQGEDETLDDRASEIASEMNLARWRAYDALPRRYIVFSLDVGAIGAVQDGIGVDAFLDQDRRERITHATPTLALGIEAEPLRNRLKIRMGSYVEPARNVGTRYRVHGTGGVDLRLFRWALFEDNPWDFRVGFVVDGARDYTNFGVTAGFWH